MFFDVYKIFTSDPTWHSRLEVIVMWLVRLNHKIEW